MKKVTEPDDRIRHRSPFDPIETYELQIVTYGIACAPYLATLQKIAKDQAEPILAAVEAVVEGFYVGDFLSGAPNV